VTVTYVNKRGKEVSVQVGRHAVLQYQARWNRLKPDDQITVKEAWRRIEEYFPSASRVQNLTGRERRRISKYGNGSDTLYFRNNFFTYVVCDGHMVTVELSDWDLRPLNQGPRHRD
jgi:hypothetical protein